jgi:hypothetical protein
LSLSLSRNKSPSLSRLPKASPLSLVGPSFRTRLSQKHKDPSHSNKGLHSTDRASTTNDRLPLIAYPLISSDIMEGDGEQAPRERPEPQIFKAPRLVSRPKPPVQQEEEMGSEIKLGDFEDVHALSVSEARAVVTAVHEARKKKDPEHNPLRDRIYNDSM